jgi:hypothetical protein
MKSEDRLKVLKMVQEGKITVEQATSLLEALEEAPAGKVSAAPAAAAASPTQPARWLRVRVTDTDTGRPRVNIRLPISVVSAGIKMGMRFSPQVEGMDMEQLVAWINSGEVGQVVDVIDDEDGEHVEVFIE